MACDLKVKRVVIPLSLILGLFALIQVMSTVGSIMQEANDGNIDGVTEIVADEVAEEVKDEIMEPLWVLLIKNPLIWLLGIIGSVIGKKFVIK
jgi:hypothetical protein